jgi:hypothetical protein
MPTRRTKAQMKFIRERVYEIVKANLPVTVRQVFYQLVAKAVIAKTEGEYNATVVRLLLQMRRAGIISYSWISDNTRWMRKPRTFDSIEEALENTAATYRRAVWSELPVYVEVWIEKEALAGVALEETDPYDVPLMVAKGFSSETYLYNAAETIKAAERPAYIYHFGDHDPSGVKSAKDVERKLRGFAPDAEIHFERVAVTPEQIRDLKLPTRPTKRESASGRPNPHLSGFRGKSVDLDAMPPLELRRLVRECIERHIPKGWMESLRVAEESERTIWKRITGYAGRLESAASNAARGGI